MIIWKWSPKIEGLHLLKNLKKLIIDENEIVGPQSKLKLRLNIEINSLILLKNLKKLNIKNSQYVCRRIKKLMKINPNIKIELV